MEHTKEDWFYDKENGSILGTTPMGILAEIAYMEGEAWKSETVIANAHLIKAAPNLYTALKDLMDDYRDDHPDPRILAGKQALAKAESGHSPAL